MRTVKTLRKLPPKTRRIARYLNQVELAIKRINKLIPDIAQTEAENIAWDKRQDHFRQNGKIDPLSMEQHDSSALAKMSLAKMIKDLKF